MAALACRMVQEQMGHASADTTVIYTRPSQESARRMVAAMDALALSTPRTGPAPAGAHPTERTSA